MHTLIRITYGFIATIAGIVACVMVATLLPMPGGLSMKVVLSGSMEPAIPMGSVVFIKPSAVYVPGDVITFSDAKGGAIPTTHRIVSVRAQEGKYIFATKGDANNTEDMADVSLDRVIGKELFSLPFLGYLIITFAKTPIGFVLTVLVPILLVIIEECRNIVRVLRERKVILAKNIPPTAQR